MDDLPVSIPPTGVGGSLKSSLLKPLSKIHFQSNVKSHESEPFRMHLGWAAATCRAPAISRTWLQKPTRLWHIPLLGAAPASYRYLITHPRSPVISVSRVRASRKKKSVICENFPTCLIGSFISMDRYAPPNAPCAMLRPISRLKFFS